MKIKYEAVFGDQALFDGAPESATHAVKGGGFYSVKNKFVSYVSSGIFNGSNVEALGGYLIAERRIIKEPKRWTWEDKKVGRLPEVGAVVVGGVTKCEYEISKITPTHIVLIGTDKFFPLVGCYTHEEFISCNNPLETPAEKAQRLEDEFVVAMLDAASQEQLMSAGFKSGVIAAYRKLKGGE